MVNYWLMIWVNQPCADVLVASCIWCDGINGDDDMATFTVVLC